MSNVVPLRPRSRPADDRPDYEAPDLARTLRRVRGALFWFTFLPPLAALWRETDDTLRRWGRS